MRVKSVPAPPATLTAVETIREAVPLVPEPEESCCDRLVARTGVAPDEASDWLTFLKGLGMIHEGDAGFYRVREEPEDLGAALLAGVYGGREIEGILRDSDRPLSSEEVFERFEAIPYWDRHHHPDPEAVWSERIERLLDWFVRFGLAERRNDGYSLRS
ncbi:hypothetical protein [Halalkalicoccus subterraneus]|uniref:hypothetical protein n=1 Tax=Halalkalicoccus subterraneus TaxID=2675002 RepID=UPI000EFC1B7D|nr:hypothetical protein [Halalkalicoccus subterraneus]